MRRIAAFLFAALFVAASVHSPAYAHVIITDQTKTKGAVLHLNPDDDPAAGKKTDFYLDTQGDLLTKDSTVQLTIKDAVGTQNTIKAAINGSLAAASYTFPAQGVYDLEFTVKTGGQNYTFKQLQRVSRGTVASALDRPSHAWAEITLMTCGIGFLLLLMTVFNRRKAIAKQSTF